MARHYVLAIFLFCARNMSSYNWSRQRQFGVKQYVKSGWEICPLVNGGIRKAKFPSRFLRNESNAGSWVNIHSILTTAGTNFGSRQNAFLFNCRLIVAQEQLFCRFWHPARLRIFNLDLHQHIGPHRQDATKCRSARLVSRILPMEIL